MHGVRWSAMIVTQQKSYSSLNIRTRISCTVTFLPGRFDLFPHPLHCPQQNRPLLFDVPRAPVELRMRQLRSLAIEDGGGLEELSFVEEALGVADGFLVGEQQETEVVGIEQYSSLVHEQTIIA